MTAFVRAQLLSSIAASLCMGTLAACSSGGSGSDAGTDGCTFHVSLGTGDRADFVPLADGDPLEVWLGFQGFRMLNLAVRLDGAVVTTADLTMHLVVEATGVEVDQVDRQMTVVAAADGSRIVEDYLIFFNDAPASQLIGHMATLEHIARGGGCVGATRVEVELRDDNPCIDTTIVVPDASVPDGGLLDGAVACEESP
jgi:hypothetical protein